MSVGEGESRLEVRTLHVINAIAYASSSRTHGRLLHRVTGIDLPPSDVRLLEFLAGRPPLALSGIAAALGLDLAQASRQATSLEQSGHLVRSTDPEDRRRTLVRLSEATAQLMDVWLLHWVDVYLVPVGVWTRQDLQSLTAWVRLVRTTLEAALPDRPRSALPSRWAALTGQEPHEEHVRAFLCEVISLVAWVGMSSGFNAILEELGVPLREHAYFTLRMVDLHGQLPVAEVADRMGIDHSQASKRLRQLHDLGLVERQVDLADRRSSLVRASAQGVSVVERVSRWQLDAFVALLGPLPPSRRRRWTALLDRYLEQLASVERDVDRHEAEPDVLLMR